ncbi:MAG: hypothetical protein Alis3KO_18010 [Aliiglaciecola sp.]
MDTLRLAFLVIGAVAIVGILVHGMWSVRKNAKDNREARLETSDWQDDFNDADEFDEDVIVIDPQASEEKVEPSLTENSFDDLGLGAVRVVNSEKPSENQTRPVDVQSDSVSAIEEVVSETHTDFSQDAAQIAEEKSEAAVQPKIYSSVVTQPKPEYAAQQVQAMRSKATAANVAEMNDIPEPPPFLLKTAQSGEAVAVEPTTHTTSLDANQLDKQEPKSKETAHRDKSVDQQQTEATAPSEAENEPKISLAEQARNFVKRSKAEGKPRKRREPKIREDQMRIDFDEPIEPATEPEKGASKAANVEADQAASAEAPEQEVLILNVKAADDAPIQGAALLPMLLTLGFKFGDQDIFHRHVNSNGKGPVLFSLANMFKPGVFDIDNLENFNTMGVSLFMMLPIEGDPHQVFNMMHNAARKIADEFSAQVLDGRRSALTKQSLQQYVEKIREFERKRMLVK